MKPHASSTNGLGGIVLKYSQIQVLWDTRVLNRCGKKPVHVSPGRVVLLWKYKAQGYFWASCCPSTPPFHHETKDQHAGPLNCCPDLAKGILMLCSSISNAFYFLRYQYTTRAFFQYLCALQQIPCQHDYDAWAEESTSTPGASCCKRVYHVEDAMASSPHYSGNLGLSIPTRATALAGHTR